MSNFTSDYKELCNIYNKKLLNAHKESFSGIKNQMDYFITYLKYLRDYHMLTEPIMYEDKQPNLKLSALITAITEYEKYQSCIEKYYKVENNEIKRISDEPEEEVMKQFNKERAFHWTTFWQLVMLNIESWGIND